MNDAASAAPTYQQVIDAWNAQADEHNQWSELGEDEKVEWAVACAKTTPPAVVEPPELSPDFTDTARAALLWVLWHHQGGSSPVGQPIRFALGMGQHDNLNEHQLAEAKRWERLHPVNPSVFPRGPELLTDEQVGEICDQFTKLVREKRARHIERGIDAGADYYIGDVAHYVGHAVNQAAHGIVIKNGDSHGLKT